MSFNPPIESESSRNDSADEAAKQARDLLQQLNQSNAKKTSTGSAQQSSIQDLLAYDKNRHDQHTEAPLTPPELPPGTFAPQNPVLEEVLTPTVDIQSADLELLTQMICDRISPRLNPEMERRGFHQSNRIFSHEMIAIHQVDSSHSLSLSSEQTPEVIEKIAQEIEQLLHYRLVYERERRGRSLGCLPW
ncbi:hypothetical protein [Chlorogloea sp. CCALA 695]|uniref:hypothetical protein n=1 Tax=Chlorogloea sp. CCALA 695 TaxID=2107693 RepID=UPI000D04DC1F|nr:hypothetical protein [Chlorogloea sp. CCALA 695]PSB28207.1 hypothetical protein C7B70_21320 [Chlorogloea sp. CCALA 695]